jgi:hypothetical protein
MDEDAAREWLLANGWEVERASLYDEEDVEGWCWTHPNRLGDYCEIGDWADLPTVPESLIELAEQERNVS